MAGKVVTEKVVSVLTYAGHFLCDLTLGTLPPSSAGWVTGWQPGG